MIHQQIEDSLVVRSISTVTEKRVFINSPPGLIFAHTMKQHVFFFAKSQVSDQRANRVFSRKLGRKVTSCQTKYLFHDCVLMHMPNAMAF